MSVPLLPPLPPRVETYTPVRGPRRRTWLIVLGVVVFGSAASVGLWAGARPPAVADPAPHVTVRTVPVTVHPTPATSIVTAPARTVTSTVAAATSTPAATPTSSPAAVSSSSAASSSSRPVLSSTREPAAQATVTVAKKSTPAPAAPSSSKKSATSTPTQERGGFVQAGLSAASADSDVTVTVTVATSESEAQVTIWCGETKKTETVQVSGGQAQVTRVFSDQAGPTAVSARVVTAVGTVDTSTIDLDLG